MYQGVYLMPCAAAHLDVSYASRYVTYLNVLYVPECIISYIYLVPCAAAHLGGVARLASSASIGLTDYS